MGPADGDRTEPQLWSPLKERRRSLLFVRLHKYFASLQSQARLPHFFWHLPTPLNLGFGPVLLEES